MWRRHSSILIHHLQGLDRRGKIIATSVVSLLFGALIAVSWWMWHESERSHAAAQSLEATTRARAQTALAEEATHALAQLQIAAAEPDRSKRSAALDEAAAVAARIRATDPDNPDAQRILETIAELRKR